MSEAFKSEIDRAWELYRLAIAAHIAKDDPHGELSRAESEAEYRELCEKEGLRAVIRAVLNDRTVEL